ncbi:hypothetical protein ACMFMG_005748 [Clarireedia jacksonii]
MSDKRTLPLSTCLSFVFAAQPPYQTRISSALLSATSCHLKPSEMPPVVLRQRMTTGHESESRQNEPFFSFPSLFVPFQSTKQLTKYLEHLCPAWLHKRLVAIPDFNVDANCSGC